VRNVYSEFRKPFISCRHKYHIEDAPIRVYIDVFNKGEKMNTKTISTILLTSLILVSMFFLAACSPISRAPVAMAQSDKPPVTGLDRSWEIDADDIAAARQAAEALSHINAAVEVDYGEDDLLRSWEIDADDIAAARQAAEALSHINAAVEVDYGEDDLLRSWEIDADDIAAARQVAQYLATVGIVSLEPDADAW
jgi:hypothetical protein